MLTLRPFRTLRKVPHHVLDGRAGPIDVEGEALVGHGQVEDAAGLQDAKEVLKRWNGILAVLDEVIGDDEVLVSSPIVDSSSPLSMMSVSTSGYVESSSYC